MKIVNNSLHCWYIIYVINPIIYKNRHDTLGRAIISTIIELLLKYDIADIRILYNDSNSDLNVSDITESELDKIVQNFISKIRYRPCYSVVSLGILNDILKNG